MKHFVLFWAAIAVGLGAAGGAPRAESPADSAAARTVDRENTRILIPVRRAQSGSVRIRSVHDNRRLLIFRTAPQPVTPPAAVPPAPAPARGPVPARAERPATSSELAELEARLMAYLDRRLLELAQRPSPRSGVDTLALSPPQVVTEPYVIETSRSVPVVVPVPLAAETRPETPPPLEPMARTERPDTADTTATTAAPPDTAGALSGLPADTTGLAEAIVDVERAIVDTELFRTTRILFELNRAELLPASGTTLSAVGVVLERHPDIRLEIRGHTDSRGTDEYNLNLSQLRADAVRAHLIDEFGIDAARLTAIGYGESQPVADERSPTGRALNRRVDFVVVR